MFLKYQISGPGMLNAKHFSTNVYDCNKNIVWISRHRAQIGSICITLLLVTAESWQLSWQLCGQSTEDVWDGRFLQHLAICHNIAYLSKCVAIQIFFYPPSSFVFQLFFHQYSMYVYQTVYSDKCFSIYHTKRALGYLYLFFNCPTCGYHGLVLLYLSGIFS